MNSEEVRYCLRCGERLVHREKFGRLRPICPRCEWVYFPDPKVAVAVLIEEDTRVLLVRRAVDPERGRWTLPAGFVDAGEDPAEAAERECLEETGLRVKISSLIDVLAGQEHERGAHILILYRGEIVKGELAPGDDVDRARFFSRLDLPPLAFRSTSRILELE